MVSGEITHDIAGDVTVQVAPPGVAVTRYVATAPPVLSATMVTVACPSPATALGVPGVPGAAKELTGVTCVESGLEAEVPPVFVAVAEKRYAVPLVNGLTTQEVAGTVTVQVAPPGVAVTR